MRKEKRRIALKIVSDIQGLDPPGRFLIEEGAEEGDTDGKLSPKPAAQHAQGVNPALLQRRWQLVDPDTALRKTLHCLREKKTGTQVQQKFAGRPPWKKRAHDETTASLPRQPHGAQVPGTAPVPTPRRQNDEAGLGKLDVCLNRAMQLQQQALQNMMLQRQSLMVAAMLMNGPGGRLPAPPATGATPPRMPPAASDESRPCVSGSEHSDASGRPAGGAEGVFNSLDEDSLHTLLRFRRSWQGDDDDAGGREGAAKRSRGR